jgi:hypothetical protein
MGKAYRTPAADATVRPTRRIRRCSTGPRSSRPSRSGLLPRIVRGDDARSDLGAGCATGEDVYCLAIAVTEYLGDRAARVPIQAGTDVDEGAIERARRGRYAADLVGADPGAPAALLPEDRGGIRGQRRPPGSVCVRETRPHPRSTVRERGPAELPACSRGSSPRPDERGPLAAPRVSPRGLLTGPAEATPA